MDIRGIEIFLAVCDKGGLTAAAHALELTQAAVSQHLAKLERDLGVQLVDRSVRPQKVTVAGDYLRRRARKLFDDIENISFGISRFRDNDIPELRLGMIESVAAAILPQLVQKLNGRVGNLSITSGTTHPLVPELFAGGMDMIITSEAADEMENVDVHPLLGEPVVLVLPKIRIAPQNWEDIAQLARSLDFIRYGRRRRLGRLIAHQFERFGIETHGSLEFDSSFALFDQVRKGLGWAATTPLCLLSAGIGPADVTLAALPGVTPLRSIQLIHMSDRGGAASSIVADVCRKVFADIVPALAERAPGLEDRVRVLG